MIFTLKVRPSALRSVYWSHTFEDLRRLTDLHVQFELVKAMSTTESLLFSASQIFGSKKTSNAKTLGSVSDLMSFAAQVNGNV